MRPRSPVSVRSVALLLVGAASLLALPTALLRADVVVDNSPAATHGTAGSHTVSGSGTTLTVTPGTDANADDSTTDLLIGLDSIGSLTISNGASVDATNGNTHLGSAAGSAGTLTIASGGTLSTAWLNAGLHPTATGTILVTGNGSSLNTGGFDLGYYGGMSSLTITDGAASTVTDGGLLERGTLTVSAGGTFATGTVGAGNTFDISTSGIEPYYVDSGVTPLTSASAIATITGSGTSWINHGILSLTSGKTADTVSLTVTDHATLTTDRLQVGMGNSGPTFTASAGAHVTVANSDYNALDLSGTVLVTGTGTTLALSSAYSAGYYTTLSVGSTGSFTAADGATVTVSGDNIQADGSFTLIGAGTSLIHTASAGGATFTSELSIIDGANLSTDRTVGLLGTTTLSGGGTLTSTFSSSTSTATNLIRGTATITGAGTAVSFGKALRIGDRDHTTFRLAAGATLTSNGTTLGYGTSTNATSDAYTNHATVTGAGTTWSNTGNFIVGLYRHADLTVSAGGVINNTGNFVIGSSSSATYRLTAAATVTGAGSQLNTTGELHLGSGTYATGQLAIADHGYVSAASTIVNNGDSLTLGTFGTLHTAALTVNTGGTVLAHDGAVFSFDLGAPSPTAPLTFGAGSFFTADSGASIYLLLNPATGFGAGTYSLLAFDPTATLSGITAATFQVATDFPGFFYAFELDSAALHLVVTESALTGVYTVAGLAEASAASVPEPSTYAVIFGLVILSAIVLHRRRPHT